MEGADIAFVQGKKGRYSRNCLTPQIVSIAFTI